MSQVSKTWCFTLNNYTPDDEACFQEWPGVSYLVYGREVSSTGTKHLQGFVTFRKACRFPSVKKLQPRAHWESARCAAASIHYCKKDGDYVEIDHRKQGQRNDVRPPSPPSSIPLEFPHLNLQSLY